MKVIDVHWMSKRYDWETPQWLFDVLNAEFGFTLDPCATPQNAKCKKFFTPEINGLKQSWANEIVFLNPPYGREIGQWVKKAYEEIDATVVCLLPARTDTYWWHKYVMKADEIRFIKGRLKFGKAQHNAPFPSAIIIFKKGRKIKFPKVISFKILLEVKGRDRKG